MDLQRPEWKDRWGCGASGADFQAIVAGMLADQGEEDEAVGDHCDGFHAEEDGDIDADVVSAVGEGDCCDG